MLILESMQSRLTYICDKVAVKCGREYADKCLKFLTKLYSEGKLYGKSVLSTRQAFWAPSAKECIKSLLSDPEYVCDGDAHGYVFVLYSDVKEDLAKQQYALENGLLY